MTNFVKSLFKMGITIAVINISVPLVRADVEPGTHILREATPKIVESIIGVYDPEFKEMEDGKGYAFKFIGETVLVFRSGTRIRLGYALTGQKVTLTRVNEWNKKRGPARAYLVDDGVAVCMQDEIEMKDGVTIGALSWFFSDFVVSISDFIAFMK